MDKDGNHNKEHRTGEVMAKMTDISDISQLLCEQIPLLSRGLQGTCSPTEVTHADTAQDALQGTERNLSPLTVIWGTLPQLPLCL